MRASTLRCLVSLTRGDPLVKREPSALEEALRREDELREQRWREVRELHDDLIRRIEKARRSK